MRKLYILELAAALWLCMAGSVSAEILHMGMRGAAVESLQNDLVEAGYLARTVDGDYGSTTVKAVSEFQKDQDRKSTRLNSSHYQQSRMPSSA